MAADPVVRFRLAGVGAMNSPRYRPAALLVQWRGHRVLLDGDAGSSVRGPLDAWLVCDERAELMPRIRRAARDLGLTAVVAGCRAAGVEIEPLPVAHTSHPTYGYRVTTARGWAVWAPEFWTFPEWAAGADLMFADAAGWNRPIRFAGGVGGHASVHQVAADARERRVRRLVFAHVGRPSIRAIDGGERPPFGEWGVEGRLYRL
ncbi:MAG TPA: MBL fold metallo-hydrolase [Nonomuraea sp.]|nr:MBL fold metallo-hydrolase [Nonomuraea sp.]